MEGGVESPFLALPDVGAANYILSLWQDAGAIEIGDTCIKRLSWGEIKAWLDIREMAGESCLSSFEIAMVRKLSEEYAGQYNLSSAKDCPPPHMPEQIDRKAVANKIHSIFGMLMKKPKEPRYEVEDNGN